MSATSVQAWVGVVAAILTGIVATFKYFDYKSKRDRIAGVGSSFNSTVDALSSDNDVKRMAAAVLLRRFFDTSSEQSVRGTAPYQKEAVEVIAGMLRHKTLPGDNLQKVLADGLRYAVDLRHADLTLCNLTNAFIGIKDEDAEKQERDGGSASLRWLTRTQPVPRVDLSDADLFQAVCRRASFRNVTAKKTTFYECNLEKAVLAGADCTEADFRAADLTGADLRRAKLEGANFAGAKIGGAKFDGAEGIPEEVERHLDGDKIAAANAVVGETTGAA